MTNSLLTEDQRGFLTATDAERKENYTKQQRHYHRSELPERIRKGVLDLGLLLEHLPKPMLQDICQGSEGNIIRDGHTGEINPSEGGGILYTGEPPATMDLELERGMIDAVAFLWTATEAGLLDPQDMFETGVKKAYEKNRPDHMADPTVDPNAARRHSLANQARRKIGDGTPPDDLTDREIRAMVQEDLVPPWVDLGAYLRGDPDAFDDEALEVADEEFSDTIEQWEREHSADGG